MKMRAMLVGVVGWVCLFAAEASGTTYYVRSSGNNANSGTSAGQAWATVAYAATRASAGDVVYVGAGTYTGEIAPTVDGTSGSRIRFVADAGGAQTGDAGAVTLQRMGRVLYAQNDDYLTFEGFAIDSTASNGAVVECSNSSGLVLIDCTITGGDEGFYQPSGGSTTLEGCTIEDVDEFAIWADGGTLAVTDCTLRSGNSYYVRIGYSGSSAVTMDRTVILNGVYGVRIANGTVTLTNCVIYDADMTAGIRSESGADGVTVVNCTFVGMNGDGIDANGGSHVVINTIFSDIGDDSMDKNGGSFTSNETMHHSVGGDRSENFSGSNEVTVDPLFVNAAGGDFSLQASSPAIDAGADASAYTTTSMSGTGRPFGVGWDIGAYEYGSSYVPADVPYATDFQSGVGDEWTDQRTDSSGSLTTFLGEFGEIGGVDVPTSLWLNTTAGLTYELTFDLYVLDDWEGTDEADTDYFIVSIDGVEAMNDSFNRLGGTQSYAHAPEVSGSNLYGGSDWDAVFESVTIRFEATGAQTEIEFVSSTTADTSNEGWGIDNVAVDEVPPVFVDETDGWNFDVDSNASLHNGSGLVWFDADNDGDLDCFVGGDSNYLMAHSFGTQSFSPIYLGTYERQVAIFDADNDGDHDLAVCPMHPAAVFENTGGLPIVRGALGIDGPSNSEGIVAGDVDGDGDTDLLVFAENGNWIALNMGDGYEGNTPAGFEDDKNASDGLNDSGDAGNGDYVSAADVNDDGYLDYFYHYGTGRLFRSDGDGTFTENAGGISVYVHNDYKFGSAWGDYDNDGDMDLFAPDARSGNAGTLWRNTGGSFSNVASSAGITSTAAMRSATWGDYDNDGDLDLYVTTSSAQANLLYTNDGDGTFTLDDLGAGLTGDYQDACFVDFDNDGDLDLSLTRIDGDGKTTLLENQTDGDAYLKVRVVGAGGAAPVGVRVELLDASGTSVLARREIGSARGYGGTEPVWAHFGGVDPASTYTVRVTWPGGTEQSTTVVPGSVSTTIGARTIAQMVTLEQQASGVRFVRWREVAPNDE